MTKDTCPICVGSHITVDDSKLSVFHCGDCGHLFTVIPPTEQDPYSEEYYAEKHRRWFEHPDTKLFRKIIADLHIENNFQKKLLDIGCGKGDFLRYARDNGITAQLIGIDSTKNSDTGITYIIDNFDKYDFGDQKFDYIVSTMVVEHVQDPRAFIRKIRSILAPGGTIMLDTINSGAFLHFIARALRAIGIRVVFDRLYDHHHLQHYTNNSLKKLMTEAGFTMVIHRNHNFPFAAIDVPNHGVVMDMLYRGVVISIFSLTALFGGELCQTVVCTIKNSN